jgi:D-sedoheptulose 7-phosphate isomerase
VNHLSDQAQESGELIELAELAATCSRELAGDIDTITAMVLETLAADGTLLFCGNGGSAADAQHLAAEYVIRFRRDRGPLRAVALTTDSSILTAGANDLGFEEVFARQVEALGREGDLLLVHSTSGESENVVRAVGAARRIGLRTVALLAKGGGRLREAVDVAIVVPTENTARAQELHLAIGHAVCDRVDRTLSGES